MGWSGKKNGVLLSLAELEFDVLVTVDQGIEYEQNLANRKMAVLVLAARSNQIEDLEPIIPAALAALRSIHPGRPGRLNSTVAPPLVQPKLKQLPTLYLPDL